MKKEIFEILKTAKKNRFPSVSEDNIHSVAIDVTGHGGTIEINRFSRDEAEEIRDEIMELIQSACKAEDHRAKMGHGENKEPLIPHIPERRLWLDQMDAGEPVEWVGIDSKGYRTN